MSKESSLTCPSDRDLNNKWKPIPEVPPLTGEEGINAVNENNNNDFVKKFQKVERTYVDPPVELQRYGLISFIPAKGATPNKKGVYGFAKLRGNYQTEIEANQRAEYIIKNIDSYNKIFHTYVGRPFPLTVSSDYSKETKEVDLKKEMKESISENVKQKRIEEKNSMDEIKEREKLLLEESKKTEEDPYELYITNKVKKAQLTWTYKEHQNKMAEIKEILIKTRKLIKELDEEHPEYKETFFKKYMEARESSGLTEEKNKESFIMYLCEDIDLGF